jgi:hypothetical protein
VEPSVDVLGVGDLGAGVTALVFAGAMIEDALGLFGRMVVVGLVLNGLLSAVLCETRFG